MGHLDPSPSFVPPPRWVEAPAPGDHKVSGPFLLALTLVGAGLRLLDLAGPSLWVDELLTWQAVQPGSGLGFFEQVGDTIQGPLYLAVLWPLLHWQDTPLMMRLPAAIAGIAAVPLFGWWAFRNLGGRSARLALLLFAVNPFHIWYSQEGRGYAFAMLLAIVLALVYQNMVRRGPTAAQAVGFGLAGTALVLSNLSGVLLVAGMGLTVLILQRPARRAGWGWWLVAFGLVGLLTAPWLLKASGIWAIDRLVPGAGTGAALRGETTFSWLALPYAVYTFFFGYSLGPSLRELHQPDRLAVLSGYWPLLVAGAAVVGCALLGVLAKVERRRLTLLVWIAVPILLLVVLAQRNIKPWNPRYVAIVMPALILLAGDGVAQLSRRLGLVVAVGLVGLTLWSLAGYYGDDRFAKADLRGAVAAIEQAQPPSPVVLVPVVTGVYRYYDRDKHQLLDSFGRRPLQGRDDADRYVSTILRGQGFCRVVLAREWYFDPGGHLLPALSRLGQVRLEKLLPGVSIYTWERTASPEGTQRRGDS